jgi:FdhD protein
VIRETALPAVSLRWRPADQATPAVRALAEETPIALVHDGSTTAVMMATPADLEDLGVGFSITEGIVGSPADVRDIEIATSDLGVEVRMWLAPGRAVELSARRRHLAGPTGCGLCGIESLGEAVRRTPSVTQDLHVAGADLLMAMRTLEKAQDIGARTRAAHAAGFWRRDAAMLVREDVGRHNALDKVVGAVARSGDRSPGVLLLTSRVSVELVQKAAVLGAPVICAVSAPTALAVRTAQEAGMTLVAVTRADGFDVFTHPHRLDLQPSAT